MILRIIFFATTLPLAIPQEPKVQIFGQLDPEDAPVEQQNTGTQAPDFSRTFQEWLPFLENKFEFDLAFDQAIIEEWGKIRQASAKNNSTQQVQAALQAVATSLQRWAVKWEDSSKRFTAEQERPKGTLEKPEDFERNKEWRLDNIEKGYRRDVMPEKKRAIAALTTLSQIASTSPQDLTGIGLEYLPEILANQQATDTLRENAKPLSVEVIQVLQAGALVDLLRQSSRGGSSMASVGGGGMVVAGGYTRSGNTGFVQGLHNVVEGDRPNISAARDGSYTYTDVNGASRTIARYVLVE